VIHPQCVFSRTASITYSEQTQPLFTKNNQQRAFFDTYPSSG